MENPLNPLGSQDPLDNQGRGPLDDPLLDAFEHNIEKPPGLTDPLVEHEQDQQSMDDLAHQLEALEASIENALPVPPEPRGPGDIDEPSGPADDSATPDVTSVEDDSDTTDAKGDTGGSFQNSLPLPPQGLSRTLPPNPPLSRILNRGSGRAGRSRMPIHRGLGRGPWRRVARLDLRTCPESREVIAKERCEDCEKYRHWPEGTTEEPRECWYDWQARARAEEGDDDSGEEH